MTFSYAINKDKTKYYQALEQVPSPMNHGELTFYLKDMMELLIKGQENVIEDLTISEAKLSRIQGYLHSEDGESRREVRLVLFHLLVLTVLGANKDIPVTRLMKLTELTRYKLNQVLDQLVEEGIAHVHQLRPKSYSVNADFLQHTLKIE